MKKLFWGIFLFFSIAMLICLIGFGVFLVKWYSCTQTKSVPEVVEVIFPEKKVMIGDRLPCTFKLKTSWSLMPTSASMTPAEGIQEGKSPEITPGKWMWGTRIWNVTVYLQPFRDGSYNETPVRILCEGGPDGREEVRTAVPGFKAELAAIDHTAKLSIADMVPETEPKNNRQWIPYLAGAVSLLLILILWLIFRRKKLKTPHQTPIWITAVNRISDLRQNLNEQKITPELALIRLTDVVRNFLEKRFSLRAERQTTPEFLESLRRDDSPLDVEQRRFLREFLSSADMIKFARLSADDTLFNQTADRAEMLIRNTAEQETKQKEIRS